MASRVIYDLIQLANGIPSAGDTLTLSGGDLVGIVEPVTFTTVLDDQVATGDTAVIGGVTFTVTSVSLSVNQYTISDGSGGTTSASATTTNITMTSPFGGTVSYMVPFDEPTGGPLFEISEVSVLFAAPPPSDLGPNLPNIDEDSIVTLAGANDIISGTAGDDFIGVGYLGDPEGDVVDGNDNAAGNNDDIIEAGLGNDSVNAGLGNDLVFGGGGDDDIAGALGDDTVFGGDGNDIVSAQFGNDIVGGDAGDDTVFGNEGNDTVYGGAGHDTLVGGQGQDTLFGGTGDDRLLAAENFTNDHDTLFGGAGNDLFSIGGGNDTAFGGTGNDLFILQDGSNTAFGEEGDDAFQLDFRWSSTDTIVGGETDEVVGDLLNASALTADTVLDLTANGATNNESGTLTQGFDQVTFTEVERFFLGSGDDSVIGTNQNDIVTTGTGADTVDAGAGNDDINVGGGINGIGGADGDADVIIFSDGDGDDIIRGFDGPIDNGDGTFTGVDTFDVSGLTNAAGDPVDTADVIVTTNGSGDAVLGFPNGESLTLVGITLSQVDTSAELAAMGIPLVPRNFIVEGTAGDDRIDINYTGDPEGDMIDANDNAAGNNDDFVLAGDGNDIVSSGLGNDSVFGGLGRDELSGGAGNDTMSGDQGDDFLDGGTGNDSLSGGAGNDQIIGRDGEDIISGGDGSDVLFGEADNDTIFGGAGIDNLSGGTGNDLLSGDAGNDFIAGGSGNDRVFGGTGDDAIFGGSGDDTLDGGTGSDELGGDVGDDTINLGRNLAGDDTDNEADVVVFEDGGGSDTLLNFDVPIDNGDGTFTGIDTLDVSSLTNAAGDGVTVADVTVSTDVNGDAVLTFPSGETLTFVGVNANEIDDPLELEAIGIPLPPASSHTMFDMIQLNGTAPQSGDILFAGINNDLIEIDEPITFTTILPGKILIGDTAVIDGITYTVTSTQSGTGDFTHKNAGVNEVISTKLGIITLESGSESPITYIIPIDDAGNIPNISQIEITSIGANDLFLTATTTDTDDIVTLLCFASGTEIETVDGHICVEDLSVGQLVQTMDHGPQPIRWIGRRTVAAVGKHAPIVIKKGTMGNARDLRVSPQHRMLVQGWQPELLFGETKVLAAAKHLENGSTIYVEEGGTVEYFHILFDQHEVIYAEGALSESFHPGEMATNSISKEACDKLVAAFPKLADDPDSYGAAAYTSLRSYEARLLAHKIYSQNSPRMVKQPSKGLHLQLV